MRYTAISYSDIKLGTWTCPQFIPGIEEESLENFKIGIERTCRLGRIAPENEGLDCYKIGTFDDEKGTYETCEPVFLIRLENKLNG